MDEDVMTDLDLTLLQQLRDRFGEPSLDEWAAYLDKLRKHPDELEPEQYDLLLKIFSNLHFAARSHLDPEVCKRNRWVSAYAAWAALGLWHASRMASSGISRGFNLSEIIGLFGKRQKMTAALLFGDRMAYDQAMTSLGVRPVAFEPSQSQLKFVENIVQELNGCSKAECDRLRKWMDDAQTPMAQQIVTFMATPSSVANPDLTCPETTGPAQPHRGDPIRSSPFIRIPFSAGVLACFLSVIFGIEILKAFASGPTLQLTPDLVAGVIPLFTWAEFGAAHNFLVLFIASVKLFGPPRGPSLSPDLAQI